MTKWTVIALLFVFAIPCLGQMQPPICPKHIESPTYPQLVRRANIMGEVRLSVTIDVEGRVQHVAAMPGKPNEHVAKLLQDSAIENMWHWIFDKPPFAPYTEVVVYSYEVDLSLPASGGSRNLPEITKIVFDLPDRVRIVRNAPVLNP